MFFKIQIKYQPGFMSGHGRLVKTFNLLLIALSRSGCTIREYDPNALGNAAIITAEVHGTEAQLSLFKKIWESER